MGEGWRTVRSAAATQPPPELLNIFVIPTPNRQGLKYLT
jgi:hypothetical protein